ncbi:aldehyde dehydrogenase, dimeric NADP-preferring-like [Sycon ciliatum]|uniref:aldehyde dehydrogenase, dimeric NADP-preferring-like n=1 Tax=Sycon ciliatum TaxID=27933 RepID=UPI0020AAB499|eukprot:scpid54707/ scgid1899/ Aldehyde dehydrogenase, dimeric NADP-preferring; ALDHIII; Aldehyde dehydrogenase 3; Aldehyde dehydrogenase family 3 member A1
MSFFHHRHRRIGVPGRLGGPVSVVRICAGVSTTLAMSLTASKASACSADTALVLEQRMKQAVDRARQSFHAGKLREHGQRIFHLEQMRKFLVEEFSTLLQAGIDDFKRSPEETEYIVLPVIHAEIDHAIRNLSSWMRPRNATRSLLLASFNKVQERAQPLGVVAVISPWNYSMLLLLRPLVGVIAAGNTAVLKPSEVSPAMEKVLAERLGLYLDPDCFPVVTGGIPETTALLKQRFDHICFTGSTPVGRIVLRAAAEHLTPCTLELGGKNPVIIDRCCDLEVTATRIMFGKSINAGQLCISCDYIICPRALQDELVKKFCSALQRLHDGEDLSKSKSFCNIINERHFSRLVSLLEGTKGNVAIKGSIDHQSLFMGLSVVTDVTEDDSLMEAEIFGPILPILPLESTEEILMHLRKRDKPLSLHVFSNRQAFIDEIIDNSSSGMAVVNDCVVQVTGMNTPFGGVGASGMGAYGGHTGFSTFSHKRTFLQVSLWDGFNSWLRYGYAKKPYARVAVKHFESIHPFDYWPQVLLTSTLFVVALLLAKG